MLSRFHLISERKGQTDGRTDRFAISISRVSMLSRDKYSVERLKTEKHTFKQTLFSLSSLVYAKTLIFIAGQHTDGRY